MSRTTIKLGFEEALDASLSKSKLNFRERAAMRAKLRRHSFDFMGEAMVKFRDSLPEGEKANAPILDDEGTWFENLLEFWKWLIESGKIQEFMKFLVETFLPALFKLIITLITAIAAI
jgi:hypothetical protein